MNNKTIIRKKKGKDDPYARIDKLLINDERLSFAARGLLIYLIEKPDDWKISVGDLINKSPAGEKAIRSMLEELKELGYLVKYPVYENGKIKVWECYVSENPEEEWIEKNKQIKETYGKRNKDKKTKEKIEEPQSIENTKSELLAENLQVENLLVENRYLNILKTNLTNITPTAPGECADSIEQIYNKDFKEVIKAYQDINLVPGSFEAEELIALINQHNKDLVIEAIKEAVMQNVKTMKYIKGILRDWQNANVRTLEGLEQYKKNYEDKKREEQQKRSKSKGNKGRQKNETNAADFERQLREEGLL